MTVQCPSLDWPEVLDECGPPEDPSILLAGRAHIGGAPAAVIAIRINETLRWSPDFRRGAAANSYHASGLDEVLETALDELQVVASELEDILGDTDATVVELPTGSYRVWVVPSSA